VRHFGAFGARPPDCAPGAGFEGGILPPPASLAARSARESCPSTPGDLKLSWTDLPRPGAIASVPGKVAAIVN
jgi:hypothetical protein